MQVYTVHKGGLNTDREFQAYVDLLQDIGIDVADVPRTPEPGTDRRWLYVWRNRAQAERFARELSWRLRDKSWKVHEFEVPGEEFLEQGRGPLAPLTILAIPTSEGTEFRLEPASHERLMTHHPNARVAGTVTYPTPVPAAPGHPGEPLWDSVVTALTAIPDDALARLGGVRFVTPDGQVLCEQMTSLSSR